MTWKLLALRIKHQIYKSERVETARLWVKCCVCAGEQHLVSRSHVGVLDVCVDVEAASDRDLIAILMALCVQLKVVNGWSIFWHWKGSKFLFCWVCIPLLEEFLRDVIYRLASVRTSVAPVIRRSRWVGRRKESYFWCVVIKPFNRKSLEIVYRLSFPGLSTD